jgi:hypothetical protein
MGKMGEISCAPGNKSGPRFCRPGVPRGTWNAAKHPASFAGCCEKMKKRVDDMALIPYKVWHEDDDAHR